MNCGVTVAFQGELGAYSHIAALKFFGCINALPQKTIADVFEAVEASRAKYGVVPFENSLEGSVNETYDMFLETDLKVVGEVKLRIVHCLIAGVDTAISDIKRVYSHPQALAQCRSYIRAMGWETIPYYDTAGSVKMLKELNIRDAAAIASELAAEIYGMKVLRKGIEDFTENYTRFLVIGKEQAPRTGKDKTSIIFTTKHVPGALYMALEDFARRNINLTMLVSRPRKSTPWEYNFYVDFEGHVSDEPVRCCLEALKGKTTFLKILGSYPAADA
ncbi:MAG: prephenate dehydratase [Nitrososphaerota archaeon]|nr:prephenate dehydratase [Aigarchaeota archaeon]MDW8076815.1 prephenate dehydratase [Nitrososphaerota archaeon]